MGDGESIKNKSIERNVIFPSGLMGSVSGALCFPQISKTQLRLHDARAYTRRMVLGKIFKNATWELPEIRSYANAPFS